ncbi:MAG: insertion sequence transposase protein, partial [Rhodobacteraceae bacterium]
SGQNRGASDNGFPVPRRHGQNERVVALNRKAWLFAGSPRGGDRAAFMYSLIVTAKMNDIDPQAWLADVLARLPDMPLSRLPELLPWNWKRGLIAKAA